MRLLPIRRPGRKLARRSIVLTVAALVLGGGVLAGVASASAAPSPQQYTACLNRALGLILNTAIGTSPRFPCVGSLVQITWSQTGPQGLQGATGPAGPAGPAGQTGAIGPAGPAGPQGATGAAGPAGPAGPAGAKGDTGATGATGATGPAGPAGPQGPPGTSALIGQTCPSGNYVSGFDNLGNIICTTLTPPPPTCPANSTFTFSVTSSPTALLEYWPGGQQTLTLSGYPGCSVTVASPSHTPISNIGGTTGTSGWSIVSWTGFTSASGNAKNPVCNGALSTSSVTAGNYPTCSNASTVAETGHSTAEFDVTAS
jgi:hypothetical protein